MELGQTLAAPPASLCIAAMVFLRAWEHIITMSGLQKPDFLTCGVFIYFLQIDNELLLCSCNGNMQLGFWK